MKSSFQTELIYIDNDKVSCGGDGFKQSHPIIYLDLPIGRIVTCPYCSLKFKRKE